jgi:cell wall-associated NlpC family hydrolase
VTVVTSEQFVRTALTQRGDRYVFAAEASPLDPDPDQFDCSELVEWTGARLGVQPRIPDGSWIQRDHCRPVPVADGIRTRGALLFAGVPRTSHCAISLGDGTTIEARGRLWGVGTWGAAGRFDHAGIIPGITYVRPGTPKPPVNQGGGVGIMPGSDGRAVEFLSAMLNITRQHYNRTHGGADRRMIPVNWTYDNAVKAAVAEFQEDWNSVPAFTKLPPGKLPVTGGADPKTCAAIGIAVKLILSAR